MQAPLPAASTIPRSTAPAAASAPTPCSTAVSGGILALQHEAGHPSTALPAPRPSAAPFLLKRPRVARATHGLERGSVARKDRARSGYRATNYRPVSDPRRRSAPDGA